MITISETSWGKNMNDKLEQQLQVLNRLYKESDYIYSRLAAKLGMTDTTFWVLYAIAHSGEPMTQNDLCGDFFFPVQTIHSAINNLRKDGLVELQVIPGTRNRKAILLTEAGKTFVANTIRKADEVEKNAFLCFNEDEREQYLALFRRHIEYLKSEEKRVLDTLPAQGGKPE